MFESVRFNTEEKMMVCYERIRKKRVCYNFHLVVPEDHNYYVFYLPIKGGE